MASKRVCVIGAGSSGLTAIKSCKEDGIDVICYERSDGIGGLWNYHEGDEDGRPSVMKSTIINTSKELSAYSDFPPPKEFANFMHNTVLLKYFELYAEKFDLIPSIKFNHVVECVEKNHDYLETGRWKVTARDQVLDRLVTEVFDGVMVCSGHHVYPNVPRFTNLEKFEGRVLHSHSLKTSEAFKDLNVLVIGIGNSAVDAVVELSMVAKKVYMSTRRGSWIQPRIGYFGQPFDATLQRRIFWAARKLDVFNVLDKLWELLLNSWFDHEKYCLKPKHGILGAHPTVNDMIPCRIMSGCVVVKGDILEFTKNGVIFDDDDEVIDVDVVVLATGYDIKFPFLEKSVLEIKNNKSELYKHMFPPNLPHPSLAIIALTQPLGCMFPIAEAQSRWFIQLINKKLKLPPQHQMLEEAKMDMEKLAKQYIDSPRHTVQVDYVPYMDDICSQFKAKPNLFKLALTDPKLFWSCWFSPCVAYQYRLTGPHVWSGAREAILTYYDRVQAPLSTRKTK